MGKWWKTSRWKAISVRILVLQNLWPDAQLVWKANRNIPGSCYLYLLNKFSQQLLCLLKKGAKSRLTWRHPSWLSRGIIQQGSVLLHCQSVWWFSDSWFSLNKILIKNFKILIFGFKLVIDKYINSNLNSNLSKKIFQLNKPEFCFAYIVSGQHYPTQFALTIPIG